MWSQWGESIASGTPGVSGSMKLQWFNHFPFYLSWWESSRDSRGRRYDHVWFVEHDAFFGGSLRPFLQVRVRSVCDVITMWHYHGIPSRRLDLTPLIRSRLMFSYHCIRTRLTVSTHVDNTRFVIEAT